MIAFRGRGRLNGRSSFGDGVNYARGIGREEAPLAVWSGGVSGLDTAAFEMDAVRSQSRSSESLYHLILSFAPGEEPSFERARAALDHVLRKLGIEDHQYVASLQNDGESGMWHVHCVANLVNPVTLRRASMRGDFGTMREAVREFERLDGWRELPERGEEARTSARDRYGARQRFREYIERDVAPAFTQFIESGRASWDGVRAWLREHKITYEVVNEYGARLVGEMSGWVARVKALGYSHRDLVDRLGEWQQERAQTREAVERGITVRLEAIRDELRDVMNDEKATWNDVHALFESRALEYRKSFRGARVVETERPGHLRISRDDDDFALSSLEERFGPYQSSREAEYREQKRAAVERLEDLVRGARLADDPQPFIETLFSTQSIVSDADIAKALSRDVADDEFREKVRDALADRLVVVQRKDGTIGYTTQEITREEDEAREHAGTLASRRQRVALRRPASKELDVQQTRAYEYATDQSESVKLITGVAGSGKTRMIREVVEAYREGGYRVRGVSVANAAVDVLRRETDLPVRSVAAELTSWEHGNEPPLSNRDVLVIDEVSTLGTKQARALLREADRAGAVVLAFGDDKQFEAVARGSGLRIMQEALDGRSIDMAKTRRQVLDKSDPVNERWMRDASEAARAGRVREALSAYHDRDKVRGYATDEEARIELALEWASLERRGITTSVETFTNKERRELNFLLREAHRSLGRLSGEDHELDTMDGKTAYAVGDRVTVREQIKPLGLFNGSACTVRAIDGATLHLERSDGQVVEVDTHQHPGIQHGYCSTEFREQGNTRVAELQYFTRHVNQRSVAVGITRHQEHYVGFFSHQEFRRGFDGLVDLAERNRQKELVRDHVELGRARDVVDRVGERSRERVPVRTRERDGLER